MLVCTQGQLLEERDLGVLLGVVTLLLGVVSRNYEGYEGLVPRLVKLLEKLRNKDVTPDYAYYGIPSPWLQVGYALPASARAGCKLACRQATGHHFQLRRYSARPAADLIVSIVQARLQWQQPPMGQ